MTATEVQLDDASVTRRLLALSARRGARPALAGGLTGVGCTYAELAETVSAAAGGLAWHGLQPGDVIGVYLPDAPSYALAVHAIRAAGGIPSPVASGLTIPDIVGQLADCGARMMLTAQPLAAAALAAADRSWVRQVISFDDAAGTSHFSALLRAGAQASAPCRPHETALLPYERMPDGPLAPAPVSHAELAGRLRALESAAAVSEGDVVLAVPPAGDGGRYTTLIDHMLVSGASVVGLSAVELAAGDFGPHRPMAVIAPAGAVVGGPREQLRVFAVPG